MRVIIHHYPAGAPLAEAFSAASSGYVRVVTAPDSLQASGPHRIIENRAAGERVTVITSSVFNLDPRVALHTRRIRYRPRMIEAV